MSRVPPRVSVVVPTFQRRDVVVATVGALGRQEAAPPFEVVVVVDGSTDGSAEALRALDTPFPLTVLEQGNQGRSAACNRGAAEAHGELLLFLDDDMEADPHLLAEHDRSHRDGADIVFGDIPLHPDSPPSFLARSVGEWAERRRSELAARGGALELTDFVTGQMSIPRPAFLGVGGFDLGFTRRGKFGGEDFDLGLRLANAGYRMTFNPLAVSRQRYVVTPARHLRQWRDAGAARVLLARKHPEHAATLLDRRERLSDRLLWRRLRVPLRWIVLGLLAVGLENARTVDWFRRVRDLEFFSGVRAAGGPPARRRVRVLCYHAVADLRGAGELEQYGVPAAVFRRQLRFLARHFRFLDGDEFRRFLGGAGVPRRAALLTFDDCFADLAEAGLPVLRELEVPAVGFAVSGLLGRKTEWIRDTQFPLLDAAGLRALEAAGVEIGSHTRTHPMLDRLDPAEVREEIEGSLDDLEAAGLKRPSLLAYPHGSFSRAVQEAARAAGLAGAFTTRPGLAPPGVDPFAVPRIEILRKHRGPVFVLKVVTGMRWRRP